MQVGALVGAAIRQRRDDLGLGGEEVAALVDLTPGALEYIEVPAREAVGLPTLKFHNLRDANATAMVADGVDVKTAQVRLGHADVRTTLSIYAKATTEGNRNAAAKLGTRFMQPRASTECGMAVG